MDKLVTVFTATYNRERELERLYSSLLNQSCKAFCWLIVDDGSTDKTKEYVKRWVNEGNIDIKYVYQVNQGKMQAINKGAAICETELFVICDSDDTITPRGIELIYELWRKEKTEDISGIIAYWFMRNRNEAFGGGGEDMFPDTVKSARLYELMKKKVFDTTDIIRTDILRAHPFPQFEGENFVPEMAVWISIDMDYERLILREVIEEGEYLSDGYTRGESQSKKNPMGYAYLFYNKYLYERKFGGFKSRLMEAGKCMAMSQIKRDRSLVRKLSVLDQLLSIPIFLAAYFKYSR